MSLATSLRMHSIERIAEITKQRFEATRFWARCLVCGGLWGRCSTGHLEHAKHCRPRTDELAS